MSGGLFTRGVARERDFLPERRPLRGAVELLRYPYGIATSGRRPDIGASLEILGVTALATVVLPVPPIRMTLRRASTKRHVRSSLTTCGGELGAVRPRRSRRQ